MTTPGPASAWAGQARVGDRAAIYGAYADYDLPESAAVQAIRRHLTGDRGMPTDAITFTGYWRLHGSIEQP